ncbi:MAG TPA: hypothetical protein VM141_02000 [Planctomycetota bacterium]|nr:hypothetical protein [Planctomycetota bacterium]
MKQGQISRKFICGSLGMMCAISSVAGALSWPKVSAIMQMRTELRKQVGEFDRAAEASESVRKYKGSESARLAVQIAEYDAKLPAGEALPELLESARRASQAARITDMIISTREPDRLEDIDESLLQNNDGQCYRQPIVLSGRTDYRSFAVLLGDLAKGRRLVLAREFILEKIEPAGDVAFRAEADAFCFLKTKGRR